MEQSTCHGTSALVDEIISDALQKLESGDLLPASEASSMSILHGGIPRARSTSISNIPGLRGYRSFTDDVIKSFIDREGARDTTTSTDTSSDRTESSDPFEGVAGNQQLESSSEFISAEKLLNEFDEDEKRCREENLFKENRPVANECASIAESPGRLLEKQVSPPHWAKNPPELDSFSYFTCQAGAPMFGEDISIQNSESTFSSTLSNIHEKSKIPAHYNPGLPYRLGLVLPGVSTSFDLPRPPTCSARPVVVAKSSLNGRKLPICRAELTAQNLRLVISPPSDANGEITVWLDCPPNVSIALSAICMAPAFRLPARILVPPEVCSVVPLQVAIPCPTTLKLGVQSKFVRTKEVTLTPESDSIPLEIMAPSRESPLDVTLLFQEQEFVTVSSRLEIREFKISIKSIMDGPNSAVVIANSEDFPVQVKLSDDSGCMSYSSTIALGAGHSANKPTKSFNMPLGQPERFVTFRLELLSPVKAPLPNQCTHRFPSTLADLRPTLPRFFWLLDEEIEFSMVDHTANKPAAWKKRVFISPCPMLDKYITVAEEPNDPTKVILKITRPPQLVFGRLKFYLRDLDGKPLDTPYGFRYPFIAPQKPQLRWHTVAENMATNVYQIPTDGKLKVTNMTAHDAFLVTPDDGFIIPGEKSIELTIRKPCKLFYGLEAWRHIVKAKARKYLYKIQDNLRDGMDPSRMLGDFSKQSSPSTDKKLLDMIPGDPQSCVRLYDVFEGTVDSIELRHVTENCTFFAR